MERTLSDQDLLDILEDVARNSGNAAARIAAVKQLMRWRRTLIGRSRS
jgi:hypothetical protein